MAAVTRAESAAVSAGPSGLGTGCGGLVITHLPASLPANRRLKSASVLASTYTTSPVTGPLVPGAHAHEYPTSWRRCGATRVSVIGPRSQARPNGQDSSQTLSMP